MWTQMYANIYVESLIIICTKTSLTMSYKLASRGDMISRSAQAVALANIMVILTLGICSPASF